MIEFPSRFRRFRLIGAAFVLACGLGVSPSVRAQAGTASKSPAGPQSGPLQVTGTLIKTFPDQSEAVMKVTSITPHGGEAVTLSPPRVKILIFRDGEIPDALYAGVAFTAEGKDMGRGKPLRVGRVTIQGVDTVFGESSDGTDSSDTRTDDAGGNGTESKMQGMSSVSSPELPLPDRRILDNFEHGVYENWHLEGDCWGQAPERSQGQSGFGRVSGAVGSYFLSTAHSRAGDDHPMSGTGVALSPEFPIHYRKLRFLIGGGNYPGECCLNLQVDGQVVRTATGDGTDRLSPVEWDIAEFAGKRARLEIVDSRVFGQRAYVLLDEIEMDDPIRPVAAVTPDSAEPVPPKAVALAAAPVTASKVAKPHVSARPHVVEPPAPRAYVMLPDGTRVEGSRLLTLEATGYGPEDNGEWGDQTFLGTTVGFGTVAVDPRVIPLHKHLWVEGYGFCIALDIGGAIKGMRIDLGQDSEDEAEAVGRQKRRVLVLD